MKNTKKMKAGEGKGRGGASERVTWTDVAVCSGILLSQSPPSSQPFPSSSFLDPPNFVRPSPCFPLPSPLSCLFFYSLRAFLTHRSPPRVMLALTSPRPSSDTTLLVLLARIGYRFHHSLIRLALPEHTTYKKQAKRRLPVYRRASALYFSTAGHLSRYCGFLFVFCAFSVCWRCFSSVGHTPVPTCSFALTPLERKVKQRKQRWHFAASRRS